MDFGIRTDLFCTSESAMCPGLACCGRHWSSGALNCERVNWPSTIPYRHPLQYQQHNTKSVNPASSIIMSCTARAGTQPKIHFHQVRTSPRVRGHTLHTQGASKASLDQGIRRRIKYQSVRKPDCVGFEKPMFSNDIGDGVTSHQCILSGGEGRAGRYG
jgi:hypothetical protein